MASLPDALTFCAIVKNEERNLRNCLNSVRDLASELVVVDTGSTDATCEIAAAYGAKILPFDFTRIDFAAARNFALDHATRRWVLMLDADETLDGGAATKIATLLSDTATAAYFLERHNHASDSATMITDYVVRLFPNRPDFRYRGRVHETIDNAILAAGGRLIQPTLRSSTISFPTAKRGGARTAGTSRSSKRKSPPSQMTIHALIFWRQNITSSKCITKPPPLWRRL